MDKNTDSIQIPQNLSIYESNSLNTKDITKSSKAYKIKCNECFLPFSDKYALLYHSALSHGHLENLCRKCFGIFTSIDDHFHKCKFPLIEEDDPKKIHTLILNRKRKGKSILKNSLEPCLKDRIKKSEHNSNIDKGMEIKSHKRQKFIPKNKNNNKIQYNNKIKYINQNTTINFKVELCGLNLKDIKNKNNSVSELLNESMDNKESRENDNIKNYITTIIDKNKNEFYNNKFKEDDLEEKRKDLKDDKCFNNIDNNKNNIFFCKNNYKIQKSEEHKIFGARTQNKFIIVKKISFQIIDIKAEKKKEKTKEENFLKIINVESRKYEGKKQQKRNFHGEYIYLIQQHKIFDLKNYIIISDLILGKGKFGQVNFSLRKKDFSPIAIKKMDKKLISEKCAGREAGIIQILQKTKLFPTIYDFINDDFYFYIVETIQGPDLLKFIKFANNLDIQTYYLFGIELIKNLQIMHNNGFLHVDIKEDNFVSLTKPKKMSGELLHFILIDYGFSVQFKSDKGIHYEPCSQLKKCGNYFYASINALRGNPISRKDDMLSVAYILLSRCNGGAPWKNITANNEEEYKIKILDFKMKLDIEEICKNKFEEINEIFTDINSLDFKQRPNYEKYINLLKKKVYKDKLDNGKQKYFIWDDKLFTKFQDLKNKKLKIEEDKEIKILFSGFPNQYIIDFLNNYYN